MFAVLIMLQTAFLFFNVTFIFHIGHRNVTYSHLLKLHTNYAHWCLTKQIKTRFLLLMEIIGLFRCVKCFLHYDLLTKVLELF